MFGKRLDLGFGVMGVLALAATMLSGCSDTVSDNDITRVPLGEVQRLSKEGMPKVMLLDPRPFEQFGSGHLPGAVNVPLEQLPSDKKQIRPDLAAPKYVIVYGANPGDGYAIAATKRLLRAGQNGARLFAGGVAEWSGAGLQLVQEAGAAPKPESKKPAPPPEAAPPQTQIPPPPRPGGGGAGR